jgi:hypothetical protein
MKYTLVHTEQFDIESIAEALEREGVLTQRLESTEELITEDGATVLILDPDYRSSVTLDQLRHFVNSGGAVVAVGAEGAPDVPAELDDSLLAGFVRSPYGTRQLLLALRTAYREAAARTALERAKRDAALRTRELGELTRIGMALSTERDYEQLQSLILTQARELSSSDAASLYLVERLDDDKRQLRFKFSQTYLRHSHDQSQGRCHRSAAADQPQARFHRAPQDSGRLRRPGHSIHTAPDRADDGVGRTGGSLYREQPTVRGDRAPVRGVRSRIGACDRTA